MRWQPPTDDPTPAEIAVACEIIQAGWSPEERDRRSVHFAGNQNRAVAGDYRREPYRVPTIRMADLDALAG